MACLSKAIAVKIPIQIFIEIDKIAYNFIWKKRKPRYLKRYLIIKKKLLEVSPSSITNCITEQSKQKYYGILMKTEPLINEISLKIKI